MAKEVSLAKNLGVKSVPLSSTIRDSSAHVDATSTNKAWIERGRLELIADQVCTMFTVNRGGVGKSLSTGAR